jgi:hypothetical protein
MLHIVDWATTNILKNVVLQLRCQTKPPRNLGSYVQIDTTYRPGRLEFINFTVSTSNLASEGLAYCPVEATVELRRTVGEVGGTSQCSDTWHQAYSHKVVVSKIWFTF